MGQVSGRVNLLVNSYSVAIVLCVLYLFKTIQTCNEAEKRKIDNKGVNVTAAFSVGTFIKISKRVLPDIIE